MASRPIPKLLPHEERVMQLFGVLPRLTIRQVTRTFYSPLSEKHVGRLLSDLERRGFLLHGFVGGQRSETAPYLYAPAYTGRQYLLREGFAFPKSFKATRERAVSAELAGHSLGISELAITAIVAARHDERFAIGEIRHDEYLRPQTVGKLPMSPDLFLDLQFDNKPASFLLEYDRSGKEGEEVWKKKIRDYLYGDAKPYLDFFGVKTLDILIIVDPPREEESIQYARLQTYDLESRHRARAWRRLLQLMAWTQEELRVWRRESWAPLFWFTIESPRDLYQGNAVDYFTASHWYRPSEASPRAFLPA